MFEVPCPRCSTVLTAQTGLIGSRVGCRRCGHVFLLELAFPDSVKPGSGAAAAGPPKSEDSGVLHITDDRACVTDCAPRPSSHFATTTAGRPSPRMSLPLRRSGPVCCTGAAGLLGGILVLALVGAVALPVWWALVGRRETRVDYTQLYKDDAVGRVVSDDPNTVTIVGHQDAVAGVVFSFDGSLVATVAHDGTIGEWSLAGVGGKPVSVNDATFRAAAYSRYGRLIAAGSSSGQTGAGLLYAKRNCGGSSFSDDAGVETAAFSVDGSLLATGGTDGVLKLWDANEMKVARRLAGHSGGIRSLAWFPDGRKIASAGDDHSIRIWDSSAASTLQVLTGSDETVLGVAVSADGRTIASAGADGKLRLWNVETGRERLTHDTGSRLNSVAFSPDGRFVAAGDEAGRLTVWHVTSGVRLAQANAHAGGILSVRFSPDGKRIATGGFDNLARIWTPEIGDMTVRLIDPGAGR